MEASLPPRESPTKKAQPVLACVDSRSLELVFPVLARARLIRDFSLSLALAPCFAGLVLDASSTHMSAGAVYGDNR